MGRTSRILSAADIREKKRAARAVLTNLKGTLQEQRKGLTTARATLKQASTIFGKAEREVIKTRKAVEKQQERIDGLTAPRSTS